MDNEITLGYLIDPFEQFQDTNGLPIISGIVEVYDEDTENLATIYKDFNQTLQTNPCPIDSLGNVTIIADGTKFYNIIVKDSERNILLSKNHIKVSNSITETEIINQRAVVLPGDGINVVTTELGNTTNYTVSIYQTSALFDKVNAEYGLYKSVEDLGDNNYRINIGLNHFGDCRMDGAGIAVGKDTTANNISFAQGDSCVSNSQGSHAEGYYTTANNRGSHSEGYTTITNGDYSHAEGVNTIANGPGAHSEGNGTVAVGGKSHAEGNSTSAVGYASHAEGQGTVANGWTSHAEGRGTSAAAAVSHAEGANTSAVGIGSHAEGDHTVANGAYSHAEGEFTTAAGSCSHTIGSNTIAYGTNSLAGGFNTIASGTDQTVFGRYNIPNETDLFQIGAGTTDDNRLNALTVDNSGNVFVYDYSKGLNANVSSNLIDMPMFTDYSTSPTTGFIVGDSFYHYRKSIYKAASDIDANNYVELLEESSDVPIKKVRLYPCSAEGRYRLDVNITLKGGYDYRGGTNRNTPVNIRIQPILNYTGTYTYYDLYKGFPYYGTQTTADASTPLNRYSWSFYYTNAGYTADLQDQWVELQSLQAYAENMRWNCDSSTQAAYVTMRCVKLSDNDKIGE